MFPANELRDNRTVPLGHKRKGARRAGEAQQSEKTMTVTLSRITNAYTQSCWIANPAERVNGREIHNKKGVYEERYYVGRKSNVITSITIFERVNRFLRKIIMGQ